jgi:hypothetical protein
MGAITDLQHQTNSNIFRLTYSITKQIIGKTNLNVFRKHKFTLFVKGKVKANSKYEDDDENNNNNKS